MLDAARSTLVDSVRSVGGVKALIHYKQPLGASKGKFRTEKMLEKKKYIYFKHFKISKSVLEMVVCR